MSSATLTFHAYEKIWYYYAYNLSWKLDGAAQTAILPILTKNNQITSQNNANKGSLANGQLNFQEFMDRIDLRDPGTVTVQLDPADLDGTAANLVKKGLGGLVRVGIATNTATGKTKISYNQMVESLAGVVVKARAKFPNDPDVADAVSQMDKLSKSIVSMRSADFGRADYLGKAMALTFNLPINKQKIPTTITYRDIQDPSEYPASGKTIQEVDVMATFRDEQNKALIKAKFKSLDSSTTGFATKFKLWVDNYGVKPATDSIPGYPQVVTDHKVVLNVWTSAKNQISRSVC